MAIVHVMRHGQVDNPRGVLYERLPGYHLSGLGRQMAEQAATFFADLPITHLRCSPLERAQESMRPIAALFPLVDVVTDTRLIEAGNVFAGQVMGSTGAAAKSPRNWRYLTDPFRPSWGEPYADIARRMTAGILAAAETVGLGGQAALVSHQLPIWVARLLAEGKHLWHDPRKRECTLASVTSFHVDGGYIRGIDYAEPARDLLPAGPHFGF
ncbi:MAG: histidine phosphatase family protein [Propionibacteriaceae bacterium]|jgi:broad specificity phosphatase PhoE|nr:histidine phosphatase family protein [Propionibacteriaceae bacterium]